MTIPIKVNVRFTVVDVDADGSMCTGCGDQVWMLAKGITIQCNGVDCGPAAGVMLCQACAPAVVEALTPR
jgi:hypothetical protein